jgi:hypothetical protein
MDDQDERLNHLSTSINRQNQLSMQIGDELDVHHQLLEDTDGAMDRTAASLGRARKRLDKVADEAKQYGELSVFSHVKPELIGRLDDNDRCTDIHPFDTDHCLQDVIQACSSSSLHCCMHARTRVNVLYLNKYQCSLMTHAHTPRLAELKPTAYCFPTRQRTRRPSWRICRINMRTL